ncbi:conserved hypothetical plastid protein (plastid) [Chondrus crispus]|uniref:Conserved hypothetical plastid protein n=1 Tax=Chondrus crispus TaxID=2769 RepID=M5DBK3_CHOCR|nr:conserved hypothetical plastid protein [Chondrus crispus]CCP38052.1 conserved hypothetical plastid protein [Chondrus crispus]|eukprot:YP_007627305.1 conserved hypothetical plastid protein (plastid) [Chondrus crispus]
MPNYYFAVASQNFLLREEPIEEILRERTNYYKNINKDIDFWLVTNPHFINRSEFKSIKTQLINPSAAIISLDQQFIQWLKLRIGFVAIGNFTAESFDMEINH